MRMRSAIISLILTIMLAFSASSWGQSSTYLWLDSCDSANSLVSRIPPPDGCSRIRVDAGSFAEWLRNLPLKPGRPAVRLYDGLRKRNQGAHHAVVDIDVGSRDLQQCADAVMRLRAEYLYSRDHLDNISFDFTSGDEASFSDWAAGIRPIVKRNNVRWEETGETDSSYSSFRKYLATVFVYAGSHSLSREMVECEIVADIRGGDVFIQGGFPGHAVIVLDVARDDRSGEAVFLLGQSYMPAQDIHVLRNPNDADLTPWYRAGSGDSLRTPEWTFGWDDLARFSDH